MIEVKVIPKSSTRKIKELAPGVFKVWVHSAPEKGKANQEVAELLAEYLGVPRSLLRLIKGEHARTKTFALDSTSERRMIGSHD